MILVYSRWVYWYTHYMNKCLDCDKEISKSTSKYCKEHGYKHRKRPSGLKYTLHKVNPTSFKKGHTPWLKGTKGLITAWNKGTKGLVKPNSGSFTSKKTKGKNNIKWAGNDVGYFALHGWVQRELGKATKCEHCNITDKRIEWANKSHEYKREVNDWLQLCKRCHAKYDKQHWGLATKKYPEIGRKCV